MDLRPARQCEFALWLALEGLPQLGHKLRPVCVRDTPVAGSACGHREFMMFETRKANRSADRVQDHAESGGRWSAEKAWYWLMSMDTDLRSKPFHPCGNMWACWLVRLCGQSNCLSRWSVANEDRALPRPGCDRLHACAACVQLAEGVRHSGRVDRTWVIGEVRLPPGRVHLSLRHAMVALVFVSMAEFAADGAGAFLLVHRHVAALDRGVLEALGPEKPDRATCDGAENFALLGDLAKGQRAATRGGCRPDRPAASGPQRSRSGVSRTMRPLPSACPCLPCQAPGGEARLQLVLRAPR